MDLWGILLTCYLVLLSCKVQGMQHLTANEELMIDTQLKMLNKLPLKTIKTKGGEIIDCIDIYKQPTLDHPLLKNHKIQMRPTELPKSKPSTGKTNSTPRDANVLSISSNVNCPQGTVPIKRTSREDLIRAKAFTESFSISSNIRPHTGITPGKHQAIVRNVWDPKFTNAFKGIEGTISIYNPVVGSNQTTTSQMWIERGPWSTRNSLQAGWMVAPDLYGDNSTRWFTYYSVKGNNPQGCFNLLCQGFIQVSQREIPGSVLPYISHGKNLYWLHLVIFQDSARGNWWVREQQFGTNIGYWPAALVPWMKDGASTVVWGGQSLGRRYGASPGMGKGEVLNNGNFRTACYVDNMKVVDPKFTLLPPTEPKYPTEIFVDNRNCYNLEKYGYNGDDHNFSFLFGGPGGSNCGA